MSVSTVVIAKPFYTSKTFWLNIVGLLLLLLSTPELVTVLPVEARPYIAATVMALNIVVRFMTTAPITTGARKPVRVRN